MRASDYLLPTGPLAHAIEGFEHREGQIVMAEAVQRILEDDGLLLVEAGTGTGKTMAYLLPALLSGRKVVVSTGTKTLQDQIMERDLPLLREHLGIEVNAACMKGLSNYICQRRYQEFRGSADASRGELARQLGVVETWHAATAVGDRAELTALPDDAGIWAQITSGADTRIGPKCAHYDECFVTHMRRRAEEAQLVVVNHHLFFADLAMRGPHGGGVLPDYDAVIFDEAHQIEDVVTQFFGVQVSTTRLDVLVRDAERAFGAVGERESIVPLAQSVLSTAGVFFATLPSRSEVEAARSELRREDFAGELEGAMHRLDSALEALSIRAKSESRKGEAIAQIARRAGQVREDMAKVSEGVSGTHVLWTERRGRRVSFGASPVDVGDLMRDELFYRSPAVVLTSATLSTGGTFSFIKRRLGIDFEPQEEILESPFDYEDQALLYLPEDLPDPRDVGYLEAAAEQVCELVRITGGGAFILCTSFRVMRELRKRCASQLEQTSFMQGEAPKNRLLDGFRKDGNAVLFATATFWEGVDVPGDALRLVIIDKLPFDVPNDPLVAARCDRIREEGGQPFMKYLVPSAALSLKQGFGRLIRSKKDRGIVAILDRRIVKKGYGKVFLRSLPKAQRATRLADVRSFWMGGRS